MSHPDQRATPAAVLSSEQLARISSYVQGLVDTDQVVGAVLYLQSGHEELLHEAYGWADRESGREMRPDTIFRARSMTKPLVGTAVLMLMEQGLLELDDPVAKYLPAFANGAKERITIRQLLSHTSGLTGAIYETVAGTQFTSLRQAVDHLGWHGELSFAPGKDYEYSDPGSPPRIKALPEAGSGTGKQASRKWYRSSGPRAASTRLPETTRGLSG